MPATQDPPAPTDAESPTPRRRRSPGLPTILVATAVAALAALGVLWLGRSDDSDVVSIQQALDDQAASPLVPEGATAEVGKAAPDVRLELLDGTTTQLSSFRGTPVVLNFWSSTCAPCLQEMPAIESVANELGGDVHVIGVDVMDTEAAGKEMVGRTGVTYPNARDPKSQIFGAFGGTALPRTVLIDADGTVVDTHSGALDAAELTDLLRGNGLVEG